MNSDVEPVPPISSQTIQQTGATPEDFGAMTISVALVTRNRPAWLQRCLQSWRAQAARPLEIVVSDDSDDPIRPEIQGIVEQFGARWIPGPRRGLYANRNNVAAHCRGTHILSADDDHEHPADLIEKCMAALKEDPLSAWVLGEVYSWSEIARGWVVPGELHVWGASYPPADHSNTWAWGDGATLCPRRVFDSGLAFAEAFRFGASYLEFGCLLHSVGQRIRILETTGVVHHLLQSGRSYDIPVEQCASMYFAILMMARVYQATVRHQIVLIGYLLKELIRNHRMFFKAFPWALRETKKRNVWLRQWQSGNGSKSLPCSI